MSTHFQDFHTVDIGHNKTKVNAYKKNSQQLSHEQSVLRRLENSDMGSEDFDHNHQKTANNNARFRTKMINARTALKMNQQQFANHLNVQKSVVQEIESGKRTPDPSLMQRINNRINTRG